MRQARLQLPARPACIKAKQSLNLRAIGKRSLVTRDRQVKERHHSRLPHSNVRKRIAKKSNASDSRSKARNQFQQKGKGRSLEKPNQIRRHNHRAGNRNRSTLSSACTTTRPSPRW